MPGTKNSGRKKKVPVISPGISISNIDDAGKMIELDLKTEWWVKLSSDNNPPVVHKNKNGNKKRERERKRWMWKG